MSVKYRSLTVPALALLAACFLTLTMPLSGLPAAHAATRTVVSLTFDDGRLSHFTEARPILRAHGMRGTFYLISSSLDRPQYMSTSQAKQLAGDGNEIGGHTLHHPRLPNLSATEQKREICDDRKALQNKGFSVSSFAYPFGAADAASRRAAAECGYTSARGVGGLVTPGHCDGCPYADRLDPDNAYYIRTPGSVQTSTSLSNLKELVTQAEKRGGGWVPLVFHHVCDGCTPTYGIKPKVLSAFLDWLKTRASAGTRVATVGEVMSSKGKSTGQSSTEQSSTEQSGSEQRNAEQSNAEQSGIEQSNAEQSGAEQRNAEQSGTELSGTELSSDELSSLGLSSLGLSGTDLSSTGLSSTSDSTGGLAPSPTPLWDPTLGLLAAWRLPTIRALLSALA
ncbi:polysaccharide deacetylase family protein [Streptomyces sp. NBC_01210]|uniref:polysaccharide deacetylase family protein n=1 Tax=Streptomyces sp. NBC_01210 TaxID=2903774 RepID=UPI002E132A98|nr:polysaccharide deacetylase family protein [Streptomyces sp. NBC_01210]